MRFLRWIIYIRWSVGFGWFVSSVVLKWRRARIMFGVSKDVRVGMCVRFISFAF